MQGKVEGQASELGGEGKPCEDLSAIGDIRVRTPSRSSSYFKEHS